jgi:hypothetical protein
MKAPRPLELPPEVARRFFEGAFDRGKNSAKADEIAGRQLQLSVSI